MHRVADEEIAEVQPIGIQAPNLKGAGDHIDDP